MLSLHHEGVGSIRQLLSGAERRLATKKRQVTHGLGSPGRHHARDEA